MVIYTEKIDKEGNKVREENQILGEFDYDNMNGIVSVNYGNGNSYKGEMKDGRRNGKGIFEWMSRGKKNMKAKFREFYDGEWLDNKRDGYGV